MSNLDCKNHTGILIKDCPHKELSCVQSEYEPSMESGARKCSECGEISFYSRAVKTKKWFEHDVKWWQFWNPLSGFAGGCIFGGIMSALYIFIAIHVGL